MNNRAQEIANAKKGKGTFNLTEEQIFSLPETARAILAAIKTAEGLEKYEEVFNMIEDFMEFYEPDYGQFYCSPDGDGNFWLSNYQGVSKVSQLQPLLRTLSGMGWRRDKERKTQMPTEGSSEILYFFNHVKFHEAELRFRFNIQVASGPTPETDTCYRVQIGEEVSRVPKYKIICPEGVLQEAN